MPYLDWDKYKQKPRQYGPLSHVQYSLQSNCDDNGVDYKKLLLYLPLWGQSGIPVNLGRRGSVTVSGPIWTKDGLYFDGTNDRVDLALEVGPTEPLSFMVHCRFTGGLDQQAISIANKSVANQQHRLYLRYTDNDIKASSYDGTVHDAELNGSGLGFDKDSVFAAVFAASNSRTVYAGRNGSIKSATNSDTVNISGLDRISIGISADSTPSGWFKGHLYSTIASTQEFSPDIVALLIEQPYALIQEVRPSFYSIPAVTPSPWTGKITGVTPAHVCGVVPAGICGVK